MSNKSGRQPTRSDIAIADRKPNRVRKAHTKRHDQIVPHGKPECLSPVSRSVGGDGIEGRGGHNGEQRAQEHQTPIGGKNGENLASIRVVYLGAGTHRFSRASDGAER